MSELVFSERLGRTVRDAPAAALGVPTAQLALDALATGQADDAHAYVDYLVEECERIFGIFGIWLPQLRSFGEAHLPAGLDAHYARLADALGCDPPLQQSAPLADGLLDACHAAIDAGDAATLDAHLREVRLQLSALNDKQAQWCWALLTLYRDELGEERLEEVMRATQEGWVTPRYAALAEMSAHEIFALTIEGMRGHLGGPDRSGAVQVEEHDDKYVLSFDPCGTGGRIRRGEPARDEPPAAQRPDLFGFTDGAHDWSWQTEGVCIYCSHCALVNEILPIEHLGAPMRVTEHPQSPDDPCRWTIYKSHDAIPDEAFRRVGKTRPQPIPERRPT